MWFCTSALTDCIELSGASDAQVARALGYSQQTIANWKKGTGQPSVGDIRELFTCFGGGDEEQILGLQGVVRAKKSDLKELELDARFTALLIERCERHYNGIFLWVPDRIPGPFQLEAFHSKLLQPLEGSSDEQADFGWRRKTRRAEVLRNRAEPFHIRTIIGETAILWLLELDQADRRKQLELLQEWNSLPNFEIRIMARPNTLEEHFFYFDPAGSATAGPAFVMTNSRVRATCIQDPSLIGLYIKDIEPNWRRATSLEEYLHENRDRLA